MKIKDIINNLKSNPMFRLSLGSKELFHSNFLEFLWEYDDDKNHRKFFDMLRELGCERDWKDGVEYILSREKENFDICIYHKDSRKICYDLIIENKVKSIPRKEQLKEYYKKAKDHGSNNVELILLSLVVKFPDKSIIIDKFKNEGGEWRIVNYDSLLSAIRKAYNNTDNGNYINDYCKFIEQMHSLQNEILGNDFEKEPYYKGEEQKLLEKVRLHDLYIKLRASKFMSLLEQKLEQKLEKEGTAKVVTIPCDDYKKYDDIRQNTKDKIIRVFLNYTIQSGTGMVAAFIYKKGNNGDKIIEVVIQGDQYRHGVNSPRYKMEHCEKSEKLSKLWNDVSYDDYMKQTVDKVIFLDEYKNDQKEYCIYGDDYVYRYFKIDDKTVTQLIEIMVKDIKDVVNNEDLWKI